MRFAELLAERSTCQRARVGCVITDALGLRVLGIGYNGNARGLANACDRPDEPGHCGCLHAEENALLKAPGYDYTKTLYTTTAPCVACAKRIINGGIHRVVFRAAYRERAGTDLLATAGVAVTLLDPYAEPDRSGQLGLGLDGSGGGFPLARETRRA
jgi:dCMP deaminase